MQPSIPPHDTAKKYAGADWVHQSIYPDGKNPVKLSPLGEAVADVLGQVYLGIYHFPHGYLDTVKWDCPYFIQVPVPNSGIATFDGMDLTSLVVLCHDRCIRLHLDIGTISLRGESPRTGRTTKYKVNCIMLSFSPRNRDGGFSARHPTMEQAIETVRSRIGLGIFDETFPGCKDRER